MLIRYGLAAALLLASAAAAYAQSFPAKPVRVIVPFPAGGGLDITARAFGQKLGDYWGQTVVIENRPGASGMLLTLGNNPLAALRVKIVRTGLLGDAGIILIALWIVIQFQPSPLAFGSGNLRDAFRLTPVFMLFSPPTG